MGRNSLPDREKRSVGKLLFTLRVSDHLTQAEMSRRIGIENSSILRRAARTPKEACQVEKLIRISPALSQQALYDELFHHARKRRFPWGSDRVISLIAT